MQKTLKRIITVILLLCVALAFACFTACDFTQSPETPTNPSQNEQAENTDKNNGTNDSQNGETSNDVNGNQSGDSQSGSEQSPKHTCSFVLEKAEEKYLKSAATCKSKAVYYKSCSCGKASETETFESGTFAAHKYVDKVCEYCSKKQPSEGLAFTLNEEETEYSVTGIGTCTDSDLVIPETYNDLPVTNIGDYAFSGCGSLTSVTVPDSVTSIGEGAFKGCSSLQEITLPFVGASKDSTGYQSVFGYIFGYTTKSSSSTIIGATYQYYYYASSSSSKYYHYYIPTSIKSVTITGETIASYAFYNCEMLTNVTIGNSVTSIGSFAFSSCDSLTSIEIPNSVTSIGSGAFSSCDSLTSITIGNSVTSIGNSAFEYCRKLTNISVASDNANYKSIDGDLYSKDGTTLIRYAIGKKDISFIIPDSVTSIGSCAFYNCSSLTSITIGNSVTSIGRYAFYRCSSLTSVTIPNSVTSIGYSAFEDCSSLVSVTFENSNGWYVSYDFDAANGTDLTLTDTAQNATYLRDTYREYYWKRG